MTFQETDVVIQLNEPKALETILPLEIYPEEIIRYMLKDTRIIIAILFLKVGFISTPLTTSVWLLAASGMLWGL